MKALVLPCVLLLAGCVVYEAPPPPRPVYTPPPQPAAPRVISQQQAVDIGFRLAEDRGLKVSAVHHVHLDSSGRWHVDLRGEDRALMLLDGRDGKMLKGHFKDAGNAAEPPPGPGQPQQTPPPPPQQQQGPQDQSAPPPETPDDFELEG
ncbi:MAG: hypothetical protein QM767_21905 [Anaeromyxobacter sp.]